MDQPWMLNICHHELWIKVLLEDVLVGNRIPAVAVTTFGKNLIFYPEVQLTKFTQRLSTCNLWLTEYQVQWYSLKSKWYRLTYHRPESRL